MQIVADEPESGEEAKVRPEKSLKPVPRWQTPGGRAVLIAIALVSAGVAAALLSGGELGEGDSDEPQAISGAPKQVTDTILQFQSALADGDFETICTELFTAEARAAAGGERCPSVLQDTAMDIKRPKVSIVSVSIQGQQATATVRASTNGGPPVTDQIRLAKQKGRYRIVSAGQPAAEK
jgi:hypothetical protein